MRNIPGYLFKRFFLPVIMSLSLVVLDSASAYSESSSGDRPTAKTFHFLLWQGPASFNKSATSTINDKLPLENAWHDGRLLSYTGREIRILSPKGEPLEKYLRIVLNSHPECIEGDPGLIERVVNQQNREYIPILQVNFQSDKQLPALQGEIIFLEQSDLWRGRLGVVHPEYDIGGRSQIEYWANKTGQNPDTVTLYSSNEALRHLFVGSIEAAAIPEGVLETFLHEHNKDGLLDKIIRVPMPYKGHPSVIFLRQDLYHDPLMRTLISETWLRDHFPDKLQLIPAVTN